VTATLCIDMGYSLFDGVIVIMIGDTGWWMLGGRRMVGA
jgi:hypothetical protein